MSGFCFFYTFSCPKLLALMLSSANIIPVALLPVITNGFYASAVFGAIVLSLYTEKKGAPQPGCDKS